MRKIFTLGIIVLFLGLAIAPSINAQISKTAIKEVFENKKQIINTQLESLIDSPILEFLYQLIAAITAYFLFGVWFLGLAILSPYIGKISEIITDILDFFWERNLFRMIIELYYGCREGLFWVWLAGFGLIVFGVAALFGIIYNSLFGEEELGINTGLQNNNYDVPLSRVVLLNHGEGT